MVENRISDSELLRFAIENGILDYEAVTQRLEMSRKQKYLDMHNRSIWLADDGYFKSKLPKGDGTYALIKRKTRSALEDEIVNFYKDHAKSFKDRFDIWVERQKIMGRSDNTIEKYRSDYKRFFEGYPFEKYDINDIDDETIAKHLTKILSDKQIRWRALKDVFGYMNGVFEKAIRDKLIEFNPCKFVDLPIFKSKCYMPPVKTVTERTLNKNDTHTLIEKLHNPVAHNTNLMANFAIEMALLTGMRVGELAGLMWNDIIYHENYICIRHSEKYNRVTKEYYISQTKNGKERLFPLTDQIQGLLSRIQDFEYENGFMCEYVFADKNGRLSKSKISDAMRNKTMSGDFSSVKSIHAIRRTFNSSLKCSGVSTAVASSLLGHTERVNEQNYTYDVSGMAEKVSIIEQTQLRIVEGTLGNPKGTLSKNKKSH